MAVSGTLSVIKDWICENKVLAGVASVTGISVIAVLASKTKKKAYNRQCGVDYPKDTVIVHVSYSQGRYVPTAGQFCLKLVTFLRVTGIPYKMEYSPIPGPKNKIPWIEYNGVAMGDSQMIINFLNKKLSTNLNSTLSAEKRALAWGIQKWIEEFVYWENVHTRWCLYFDEFVNKDLSFAQRIPLFQLKLYKKYFTKMTYMVGIGRHTKEEVSEMIQFDMRQFSAILGTKKYIMGDEITEVDCAAFGIIGNIYYQTPVSCAGRQLLLKADEMKNVRDYLERIKTQYWSDWDQLTLK